MYYDCQITSNMNYLIILNTVLLLKEHYCSKESHSTNFINNPGQCDHLCPKWIVLTLQ